MGDRTSSNSLNNSVIISVARANWFQQRLLEWSKTNARRFAWRTQHDPYAILVAELMLRRTQARQVESVYLRFMQAYPGPEALADANEKDVLTLISPLGLTWRAAKFIPLARLLVEQFGGHVPCERAELLALPGVGPYVADAVRIFACDKAASLVDTNTVRVAGRYFGFHTHAESRRQRPVQMAVNALIEPARAREANLALLDFAALICQPKAPLCAQCPVASRCIFGREIRQRAAQKSSTSPNERTD